MHYGLIYASAIYKLTQSDIKKLPLHCCSCQCFIQFRKHQGGNDEINYYLPDMTNPEDASQEKMWKAENIQKEKRLGRRDARAEGMRPAPHPFIMVK